MYFRPRLKQKCTMQEKKEKTKRAVFFLLCIFFPNPLNPFLSGVLLEPIPATCGQKAGYSLERTTVCRRVTQLHIHINIPKKERDLSHCFFKIKFI